MQQTAYQQYSATDCSLSTLFNFLRCACVRALHPIDLLRASFIPPLAARRSLLVR